MESIENGTTMDNCGNTATTRTDGGLESIENGMKMDSCGSTTTTGMDC
jgi:hypothetical protein